MKSIKTIEEQRKLMDDKRLEYFAAREIEKIKVNLLVIMSITIIEFIIIIFLLVYKTNSDYTGAHSGEITLKSEMVKK